MGTLYSIFLRVYLIVTWPGRFLRLRNDAALRAIQGQLQGRYDRKLKQALTNRHVLWIHAGRARNLNLCTQLIRALGERAPNLKIVVSVDSTRVLDAFRKVPGHISRILLPIDRRSYVSRSLSVLHPETIVMLEPAIRPNLFSRARSRGIPIFLVDANRGERLPSHLGTFGFLYRPLLGFLAGVGVESAADGARYVRLGCRPEAIRVLGKLDGGAARLEEHRVLDVPALLDQLGIKAGAPLIVAGRTSAGEEVAIAEQFARLQQRWTDAFLVITPRHFERSREAGERLQSTGLRFVYRTELTSHTQFGPGEVKCLLLNTTGELKHFYQRASLIVLGRTFLSEKGHEPTEVGALGKPIIFGPNMGRYQETARLFLQRDAAIQVRSAAELEPVMSRLLENPMRGQQLGLNATKVVAESIGAMDRMVEGILPYLESEEVYVAPAMSESRLAQEPARS